MGKKKKHKKKGRDACIAESSPEHREPTPAQDTAFFIPHIFDAIPGHVDIQTLLVSCQRVSRPWRNAITSSSALQQDLYFRPRTRQFAHRCICGGPTGGLLNPLLLKHFSFMFETEHNLCQGLICHVHKYELCEMCGFKGRPEVSSAVDSRRLMLAPVRRGKGPGNCGPGRRWHHAFMRKGASWRRMLPAQPPIMEVEFKTFCYPGGHDEEKMMQFPEGLRMGQLFDLMYSICFAREPGDNYGADFIWHAPSSVGEEDPISCVTQGKGCRLVVCDSVFLYVPRYTRFLRPDPRYTRDNWWYHRRKFEEARRQTSNKWKFRCEEFVDGFVDFGTSLEERLAITEAVKRVAPR